MKTIKLDHITKIEGHARLNVKIDKGKVQKVKLDVIESARFFEAIVRNRKWDEVSPLTARICGVCSPSHHITSLMAVENAFGIEVSEQTKMLRKAMLYGSIIGNHCVHLYFLALPDYLGFESAIAMAGKRKEDVTRALMIKKLGNEVVRVIGGREVHPITPLVGGFSKVPTSESIKQLLTQLKARRDDVVKTVELFKSLPYQDFERETQQFALINKDHSFDEGNINCVGGMCIPKMSYTNFFSEQLKQGSTSKVVLFKGKSYCNGALARLKINPEGLTKDAKSYLKYVKFNNPEHNNFAQAIEILHSFDRLIEMFESMDTTVMINPPEIKPKEGRGVAITEAPRGLLFHDYQFDSKGFITSANIITPTTQNLKQMENDIKDMLPGVINKKSKEEVILDIERLIRAYDPCISCSAHFLEVKGL
jgi:sulfhydrogenase subunit alpha